MVGVTRFSGSGERRDNVNEGVTGGMRVGTEDVR